MQKVSQWDYEQRIEKDAKNEINLLINESQSIKVTLIK